MDEVLYDYVFHYNPYTKYWHAVERSKKEDYFNGSLKPEDVIKNKDVTVLIDFIIKYKYESSNN